MLFWQNNSLSHHFDLLRSMSGFPTATYWCEVYEKPMDHKKRHLCTGTCGLCYRYKVDCPETDPTLYNDCGRILDNADCFGVREDLRKNCKIYCGELFFCELCGVIVSNATEKGPWCQALLRWDVLQNLEWMGSTLLYETPEVWTSFTNHVTSYLCWSWDTE